MPSNDVPAQMEGSPARNFFLAQNGLHKDEVAAFLAVTDPVSKCKKIFFSQVI